MVQPQFINRWGPVILWAGLIFGLSSIPTLPKVKVIWWDFILKKTAHLLEYGIFWYWLWRAGLSIRKAGLVGLIYAISDEIHQRFVPGRTAKLTDVGFDSLGMALAVSFLKHQANQKFTLTVNLSQTKKLATQVMAQARLLGINTIWLQGDLGSGKTTFTQAIARHLGITRPVTSPTFILMRDYQPAWGQWQKLYHVDLYRLKSAAQLKSIDLPELWGRKENLVVVEWAQKITTDLPTPRLKLKFKSNQEQTREVTGEIIS